MAEVPSQLDAMRAGRRAEAAVAAWRGRLQLKSARRERDAALSELRAAAVAAHQVALETALERSGREADVMVRVLHRAL
jgi:hypothetical protein